MKNSNRILLLVLGLLFFVTSPTLAQYGSGAVTLPWESQKASVSQTIGLTDITINYHRPAVKGRKIWDGVVPFNDGKPIPWRGGANENTTISFSTDVTIEGNALASGTYGLHFIPSATDWIVIFSRNNTSWGSFSYNKAEDALRIHVQPQAAEFEEYLKYEFVHPEPNKTLVQLQWEKLKIAFSVSVDLEKTVLASIHRELRNSVGFSWVGYNTAAMYCSEQNMNLQEALEWTNTAISSEERFENLETKSRILNQLGKTSEADSAMKAALAKASALQIHSYGRALLGEKKTKEAMEIFQLNFKKNPDQWFVYSGLARGYEAQGDMKKAIENMRIAVDRAPEASKPFVLSTLQQWEKASKN